MTDKMNVYECIAKCAQEIVGFPGYYVYPDGRVYSEISGRFLKPLLTNGYHHFVLTNKDGKKRIAAHILVLEAFVGPRPEGMVGNHKNLNRVHNILENLEWVTQSENVKHAYANGARIIDDNHKKRCAALGRSKRSFTDDMAAEIKSLFRGKRGEKTRLAEKFGISRYAVATILGE